MNSGFGQFRKEVEKGFQSDKMSFKSFVAMFLFGIIILVFVFFGYSGNQGTNGMEEKGYAGLVGKKIISHADVQNKATQLERMYAPMFGGNIGEAQRQFINQQALESVINQEVIYQIGAKEGIISTDAEVRDFIIKEIPAFQKNGKFQSDLYFSLLQANRISTNDFENSIRVEKVGNRTQMLFQAASAPTELEIQKIKELKEQKLNVSFLKLDKETVMKQIKVSSDEVTKKLTDSDFAKQVQDYFNANKAEFNVEAQVKAQHILIKVTPQRDEATAKKEIERIATLASKEDFGKLASQFSEDEGSKKAQGDLGYFGAGRMVPEFEKAAFSQAVGSIGSPVKTQFGFHLIKVLDKKEAGARGFDDVKNEIAQKLLSTQIYEKNLAAIEDSLKKEDLVAVENEAKKMGVTWQETGFFDLSEETIPKLESAEASNAVAQLSPEKKIYPQMIRDGAHRFILKLKDSKKESLDKVDSVKEQIVRQRAMMAFQNWVEASKKTVKIERHMMARGQ